MPLRRPQEDSLATEQTVGPGEPSGSGAKSFGCRSMANYIKALIGLALLAGSPAWAAGGSWKFIDNSGNDPMLIYSENGKTVFLVGCGRAFGIRAKYPGATKAQGNATITIANSKTKMKISGEFEVPYAGRDTDFVQWDLGYRRQDPRLYGRDWNKLKTRLFSIFASGEPLTLSAENRSYEIPPANVSGWKETFDACGR
jgi:hypothetical protein